ncbi:uncharacterized protein MONOS_17678 [Monocercomonoides exilis]|uniref:uncharacterized protein n=1 Tax=Monocercomonoides exilis TaxID=2049356 RepID=UPI00355A9135|nr:hypothetical protein MONOS_17678 [Monocercomonoides exilis]
MKRTKAASKKEENEENQKEVEMALLALRRINMYRKMEKELYFNEIKEIVQHHKEHHNLTQLSYQSAWQVLIEGFCIDKSLEEVIVNELHFSSEAAREILELLKCIDWKRKEEENGRREVQMIKKWLNMIYEFFRSFTLRNEELAELMRSLIQLSRAAKGNNLVISNQCFSLLGSAAEKRNVKIDDLLKSGAIIAVLEEMKQSTLKDDIIQECLNLFYAILRRLKKEEEDEIEEAKRQIVKMELHEKMEEEGYEDAIAGFHKIIL